MKRVPKGAKPTSCAPTFSTHEQATRSSNASAASAPRGDFTHEEGRCTFETLVLRTGIKDPALARVAEIVHDIDIKDGKFGHPEASGVQQLLLGILMTNPDDEARLDRGFALFDDLYQSFRHRFQLSSSSSGFDRRPAKSRQLRGGRT